jgi:hypothetical protein
MSFEINPFLKSLSMGFISFHSPNIFVKLRASVFKSTQSRRRRMNSFKTHADIERGPEDPAWIKMVTPLMTPPSLKDNTADVDRILKGLQKALGTEKVIVDLDQSRQSRL